MKKPKNKKGINKNLFIPKSIPFVFVTIISILLIFIFSIWIWSKTNHYKEWTYNQPTTQQESTVGKVEYVDNEGELPYICKKVNGNIVDDFKVMSVSDLHLNGDHSDFTLKVLEKFIDTEKPDLIVLDGDNVYQVEDTKWQKKLNQLFESKEQYWTFVLGNHDCQGLERSGNNDYQSRKMLFNSMCGKNFDGTGTKSKYCLASSMIESEKNGVGTHFINIRGSNNKTMQTLFMFDYYGLNYINNEIINWYETSINQIKTDTSLTSAPESIAFIHKPLIEMKKPNLLPSGVSMKYVSGMNHENFNTLKSSNGLVEKFLNNNTSKVIFGHDHVNTNCFELTRSNDNKKLQLAYTCALSYYCYTIRNFHHFASLANLAYILDTNNCWYSDGVTNFFIKANQSTIMHHRFAQQQRIFDGMEKDLFFMCHMQVTYNGEGFNIANRILLPYIAGGCFAYYAFCIYYYIDKKKGAKK